VTSLDSTSVEKNYAILVDQTWQEYVQLLHLNACSQKISLHIYFTRACPRPHARTHKIAICLSVLHVWCIIQNSAQTKESLLCRTNTGQLFKFKNWAEWSALSLIPFPWEKSAEPTEPEVGKSERQEMVKIKYLPLLGTELNDWVHSQSIYQLNYFN
jgi:hypothetical protein